MAKSTAAKNATKITPNMANLAQTAPVAAAANKNLDSMRTGERAAGQPTPKPVAKAPTPVAKPKMTFKHVDESAGGESPKEVAAPVAAPVAKGKGKVAPVVAAPVATETAKPKATPFKGITRKDGLRSGQVKILQILVKSGKAMTRKEIGTDGKFGDISMFTEYLGSNDETKRLANDVKYFPSLISKGFVKFDTTADGATAYSITADGKKAAAAKE